MAFRPSEALAPYWEALEKGSEPQLTFHPLEGPPQTYTRAAFRDDALRGAGLLRRAGLDVGDCVVHGFSGNHPADLVFRLAAVMAGTVPVTINWDADSSDRMRYKLELTAARLLIHDAPFAAAHLPALRAAHPGLRTLSIDALAAEPVPPAEAVCRDGIGLDHDKLVIFTSGTTGMPKGVRHSYRGYRANRDTFATFLQPPASFCALLASPLHHANASAVADWCLREPGATIHLLPRYRGDYWRLLAELAETAGAHVIAPLVSRQFDFLANLEESGQLTVAAERLHRAGARVVPLLGSAPVGPTTVARCRRYLGKLPRVRFGSTETCLQVMGIPIEMAEREVMAAFERGWSHPAGSGYFIGRPHPPWTEVRLVKSIDPDAAEFMRPSPEGEPGFLITRGENLMAGYVRDQAASARVLREDGWYTGLLDVAFHLTNPVDRETDFYWMSRASDLLIRGGANYACEQIAAELKAYLVDAGLPEGFDLAVVGKKIDSEHEDACCVMIALAEPADEERQAWIRDRLLNPEPGALSKGARPDRVRFGTIPRNFKGAIQTTNLRQEF